MKQKKLIRQNFRDAVFGRDNNQCTYCCATNELDAHHITDRTELPNGGYVLENGITLCQVHHIQAEQFHSTNGESWAFEMHPNDLYTRINSSYDVALEASAKLSNRG